MSRTRAHLSAATVTGDVREETESLLMRIIAVAPMSMAIVGMDGTIEYINQKSIDTFGYRPADIPDMDRWWMQAYPDPDYRKEVIQRWTAYVTAAFTGGHAIQRDTYRITCKDGSVKTVAVFGIPVAEKVFVMFDDITDQTLKEDSLIRSREELERRVEARTVEIAERNRSLQTQIEERRKVEERLVQANVALERTAVQLRKLGAKLARVEEHERKRMAHILHDQLQQSLVAANFGLSTLQKGLTDKALLKTARAAAAAVTDAIQESKSLVLELSPPVLREGGLVPAMKWIRTRMREKHGLHLDVRVDKRAHAIAEDLRLAIFHAVRELLLNVVKHSGVASAKVNVRLLPGKQVQVTVADRGCGYVPSESSQENDLLAGFGLMAVRERFDALGGSMTIESAPGKGCCVTLLAPLVEHPVLEGDGGEADRPAPSRSRKRGNTGRRSISPPRAMISVLLVDDHTMLRQGLAEHLLHDPEIEVIGEASDGEIAVQKARSLRPDVVLMDVSMPKMSGIEATRIIHEEFPKTVIIGLSMYAEPHRAEEMRKAGASAYVSKSEAAEALVATIHACCNR